jgi:hypothetical protein
MSSNFFQKVFNAKLSWPIKLSFASDVVLVFACIAYLIYVSTTEVTKQSIYLGPITFWTAALLGFALLISFTNTVLLLVSFFKKQLNLALAVKTFGLALLFLVASLFASGWITNTRLVD